MIAWLLYGGMALCLFSLWVTARRDWVRLRGISRQVIAEVTGHQQFNSTDGITYAAIYRFTAEDGEHQVIDQVYSSAPRPPVGTRVALSYPAGRTDLARVPRPLMWLAVYALLIGMFALLFAHVMGWLD